MSAKLNAANSVLYAEIQKAIKNGIIVIGAAGNNGDDAQNYMPGSVDEAYIVGACDEDGIRLEGSNYGRTVDFNVIADTTSEAAAKFTGYASINGISNLNIDENNTLHLEKQEIENPDKPDIQITPIKIITSQTMMTSLRIMMMKNGLLEILIHIMKIRKIIWKMIYGKLMDIQNFSLRIEKMKAYGQEIRNMIFLLIIHMIAM